MTTDRTYRVKCRDCEYGEDGIPNVVDADNLAGKHQFENPEHTVMYRRVDIPRGAR